jgi:ribosome-interacting GTPase 1
MPANLSPEFLEARAKYKSASTLEERVAGLREMIATIPKHKGTEKMQADLKSRLAKLQSQLQSQQKGGGKRYDPSHVEREGAGQVVVVGAPNSGKSALVDALTNAEPEVADYPFTTRIPQPAMMPFENVQIQLVDSPAVSETFTESWLPNLVRQADVVLLVSDAGSDGCLENVEAAVRILDERKVELVQVEGPRVRGTKIARMPTVIVANKAEAEGAEERIEILEEFFADRLGSPLRVSAATGRGLEELKKRLFDSLFVIRVCSKAPGKDPDTSRPFVLPQGATVADFAQEVHADFAKKLKFARLWGQSKFDGQRVQRDHVLYDGDIVELHM